MIDLHLHLDGSLTAEDITLLADLDGASLPCRGDELKALLQVAPHCRDLGEYLTKFELPLRVLQTERALETAVYLLMRRLSGQGLCYAEIRFAPQLHLQQELTQKQVISAAVRGLKKAVSEFAMPAQLIACCMRGGDLQANLETVRVAKEFLGRGVCAVDLAGNEAAYPTEDHAPVFALAGELGVPTIIHAGEAAGPESIWQALSLGARRIGHGIHATEDAALVDFLAVQGIPLELCYTSNLQTRAATQECYPLVRFLQAGICVTVNTDNMVVSGTDLRQEYLLLQARFALTDADLQHLACSAADAAFVSEKDTATLKAQIADRFALWLHNT